MRNGLLIASAGVVVASLGVGCTRPAVGTIEGVTQRRVCGGAMPVDPPPDWDPCGTPTPVPATVTVRRDGEVVATVRSGADGHFRVTVKAGTYVVDMAGGDVPPVASACAPVTVVVPGPPGPPGPPPVTLVCTLFAP
jgi:hypothetical protein